MPAISFDVWMTLLDSRAFMREFAEQASRIAGLDPDEAYEQVLEAYAEIKRLRAREGIPDDDIVQSSLAILLAHLPVTEEVARRALARTLLVEGPERYVLDSAHEVLGELRRMGFSIAVVGNVVYWPGAYTRVLLERVGLADLIDVQVYADEARCSKPRPCIFERAEKLLKAEGANHRLVAHVGDSFREDFLGALNYGLKAVLVDRQGECPTGELIPGRAYAIRSLKELPPLARRWVEERV